MSILVLFSATVLLLSLLFLALSVVMIVRKYSVRGAIITVFFSVMSVKYLIALYLEFLGYQISLLLFVGADVLILLILMGLMISR